MDIRTYVRIRFLVSYSLPCFVVQSYGSLLSHVSSFISSVSGSRSGSGQRPAAAPLDWHPPLPPQIVGREFIKDTYEIILTHVFSRMGWKYKFILQVIR